MRGVPSMDPEREGVPAQITASVTTVATAAPTPPNTRMRTTLIETLVKSATMPRAATRFSCPDVGDPDERNVRVEDRHRECEDGENQGRRGVLASVQQIDEELPSQNELRAGENSDADE